MSMMTSLRPLKEWLRQLLHGGLRAVAAEEAADLQVDVLDAQRRLYEAAIEASGKTKLARESGDDLERQLAEEFGLAIRETTRLGRIMLGDVPPEERPEVLSRPFSDSSGGSPSLKASMPDEGPAALDAPMSKSTPVETRRTGGEGESIPRSLETPKRRGPGGRPKGSKNRPKPGQAPAIPTPTEEDPR